MKSIHDLVRCISILSIVAFRVAASAGESAPESNSAAVAVMPSVTDEPAHGFHHLALTVDGVAREALFYAPATAKESDTPVVFVFHGHGGSARNAERTFAMDQNWPEAISVYMQGLNTPGRLVDPEGQKPGWQGRLGDQGDRDLKFFDATFAWLKQNYKVAAQRVYATGHSNGGGFSYLLWAERGDQFAAFAPCAAVSSGAVLRLKPKPAMHIAGSQDSLVKYEWQRMTMDAARKIDGCAAEGTPWAENCTLYPSSIGTPFVEFVHPGGHVVPETAPALIVKFFKEHPAPQN